MIIFFSFCSLSSCSFFSLKICSCIKYKMLKEVCIKVKSRKQNKTVVQKERKTWLGIKSIKIGGKMQQSNCWFWLASIDFFSNFRRSSLALFTNHNSQALRRGEPADSTGKWSSWSEGVLGSSHLQHKHVLLIPVLFLIYLVELDGGQLVVMVQPWLPIDH